jgi:hypothetical protein
MKISEKIKLNLTRVLLITTLATYYIYFVIKMNGISDAIINF